MLFFSKFYTDQLVKICGTDDYFIPEMTKYLNTIGKVKNLRYNKYYKSFVYTVECKDEIKFTFFEHSLDSIKKRIG